jgi:hypothetical protein
MVILLAAGRVFAQVPAAARKPADAVRIPVIYSTDLFHPHDDPDDHFDLATLFAIERLEVRAVLLDLGERQKPRPGRLPLEQMFSLTGERVPYGTGLSAKLKSPSDDARDQSASDQGAVDLLLKTLRESREPVTIITAGSLRDVSAALNRDRELMRRQVARLYINIGHADGGDEWNISLDSQAFVNVMRSGLPIYFCPCQPFRDRRSTFWEFTQSEVLEAAPTGLQNFFIYALQVVPPDLLDPQAALKMDLRAWRRLVWGMKRQMWCTPSFLDAARLRLRKDSTGHYVPEAMDKDPATSENDVFTFLPARVEIDDAGHTRTIPGAEPNMHVFASRDVAEYGNAMRDCVAWLFSHSAAFRAAAQ